MIVGELEYFYISRMSKLSSISEFSLTTMSEHGVVEVCHISPVQSNVWIYMSAGCRP